MAYNELIKDFEKIRKYIREFYIYGFKSRSEYSIKSSRSYDDEKRRMESWLGRHMTFTRTSKGKIAAISIDSRAFRQNPLYRALKTASFTPRDITLHFILFDLLYTDSEKLCRNEILDKINDCYLKDFKNPMEFDDKTLFNKLKEYISYGFINADRTSKPFSYTRTGSVNLSSAIDAVNFFSEAAPCGIIGSFIKDLLNYELFIKKLISKKSVYVDNDVCKTFNDNSCLKISDSANTTLKSIFLFKHHYITQALDSDILASLFTAMHEKSFVSFSYHSGSGNPNNIDNIVPIRIYISAQSGRQHLLAYRKQTKRSYYSFRIDYMSKVKITGRCEQFEQIRIRYNRLKPYIWGVNFKRCIKYLEHVEFTVVINPDENHILHRLEREKRCGNISKIDDTHYKFSADIFDTNEIIPWIRTFICRITQINFSNRSIENRFKKDIQSMYEIYGI